VSFQWALAPSSFEFHFSHVSEKIRRRFLERVSREDFGYAGFVVDERKLYGERFKDPKQFYEFSVGIVCENVRQLLTEAKVIIDKSGDVSPQESYNGKFSR